MPRKIYIDTNIWIDYWTDRRNGFNLYGELARQMLGRVLDCEFEIVISDLILKEIKDNFEFEVGMRFDSFRAIKKLQILRPDKSNYALIKAPILPRESWSRQKEFRFRTQSTPALRQERTQLS